MKELQDLYRILGENVERWLDIEANKIALRMSTLSEEEVTKFFMYKKELEKCQTQ